MATALYRLGRTAYRRWPLFILAWVVLIGLVGGFAAAAHKPMNDSFTISGIPSLQAADLQKELFPNAVSADKQVNGQVVVQAPAGHTLAEQPYKGEVDALVAKLAKTPQLTKGSQVANPAVAGPALTRQVVAAETKQGTPAAVAAKDAATISPLSADGRTGIITWTFDVDNAMKVDKASQDYVHNAVDATRAAGLTAAVGGNGMQAFALGGKSELIGIGFALVILTLTFGSLVAAGLPIIGAIVGVATGGLFVTASTAFFDISSNTPTLSSMIGLAVGIDYALFILSRYRTELRRSGDREHAIGIALGTAGSAVVFAGLTVVVALAALWFSGISVLGAMGTAAAGTVTLAVLVALTLLPALLGMLKHRAFAGRVRRVPEIGEEDHELVNGSVRLGRGIQAAPIAVVLLAAALLGGLAAPVANLHLGLPSDATAAVGTDARTSADMLAAGWGPGKNAPMITVVDARGVANPQQRAAAVGKVVQWAAQTPGVAHAQVVQATKDMSGAVVLVTPRTGPADTATDDLLTSLRDHTGSVEQATGTHLGVTGITAIQADISKKLTDALPVYLGIVVVLAFLILTVVFRSLVVPAIATLGFLLSVLATLGTMVKLVQDGTFGIFDPQPIMSLMPTLLIGIVFGLAMDYQVFLTTRMREAYVHGMNPADAVIDGFRHSGRVVTAAALIMISVFAAFAFQDNALIKSIGIGLAVAVLLDAFVVRMVLIPALMTLLGRVAWWMPRWLDRITPHVDVEGAGLERDAALAGAAMGGHTATAEHAEPAVEPVAEHAETVTEPAGEPVHEAAPVAVAGTAAVAAGATAASARRAATETATAAPAEAPAEVVDAAQSPAEAPHTPDAPVAPAAQAQAPVAPAATAATDAPVAEAPAGAAPLEDAAADVAPLRVTGTVRTPDGAPLRGAYVTVADRTGRPSGHAVTDADGGYAVDLHHGGTFLLVAAAEGMSPAAALVPVADGSVRHDVVLAGAGEVVGSVVRRADGTGALPVADARLTLTDSMGSVVATVRSDATGRYTVTGLPAGDYVMTAQAQGHHPHATAVAVPTTGRTVLDITLRADGLLRGVVLAGDDHSPVRAATVTLTDETGQVVARALTGTDGRYEFPDLAPGTYTLVAAGYAPVAQPVAVTDGAVTRGTVLLGGPTD